MFSRPRDSLSSSFLSSIHVLHYMPNTSKYQREKRMLQSYSTHLYPQFPAPPSFCNLQEDKLSLDHDARRV